MNIFTLLTLLVFAIITLASKHPHQHPSRAPPLSPSHERRGVTFNDAGLVRHFDTEGSHVTWICNWDSTSSPTGVWFKFVPMLHSLRDDHIGRWKGNAEQVARDNDKEGWPTWLLGFNEPDNCDPNGGGTCMSVSDAVAGWKKHIQPLKNLNGRVYLGSPAVTNAAPSDTTGLGWLAKFIEKCDGCTIDHINIHWYDHATNVAYFKWYIDSARKVAQGRPIWITEFRAFGTDDEVKRFLREVMPWMDNSVDIHRYAYFMARPGDGMLINGNGDGLSDIGRDYVSFHQH